MILPFSLPLYLAKSVTVSALIKITSALIGPFVPGVHALGDATIA